MSEYSEMPWSIEETIQNFIDLKKLLKEVFIAVDLHGKGKQDAEEMEYDFERAIKALEEVQHYHEIGTLEECRVAVEKQKPKKPTYEGDGYAPDGSFVWDEWLCPNCGSRYELDYDEHDCRPNCGQKIDWSKEV